MNSLSRLPSVMNAMALSRASIYLRVKQGLLTPPVKIGLRAVAWPADEITLINAARIAGKADADIRKLVAELEKHRATTA